MIKQAHLHLVALIFLLGQAPLAFADETSESLILEEVTVTAQKRAENLQQVPLSISAFSAEDIENAGWHDIDQVQFTVPSMVVGGESLARPYFFIRGIGTRKFDIGTDGSIGIFVDEVYNARFNTALVGIVDLERIEVLKGPQGTLYGRNTIGGAISMYTKKPSEEFDGRVKVGFGNDGYYQVGGSLSGGLAGGKLAGRLSFVTRDEDGVFKDTVSGKDDNNHVDAARISLLVTPSDNWEIALTGEISEVESDASLTEPYPGPVAISPFIPPEVIAAELADAAKDRYSNAFTRPGFVDRDSSQLSLKIGWHGENVEFTSITSRNDEEYTEDRDFDGYAFDIWQNTIDQSSTQYSQEFRLNSVDGGSLNFDDKLQWVAGVYYFTDDADRLDNFPFGPHSALGPPPPLFPGLTYNDNIVQVKLDTKSYALYGQATYAITPKLGLTLGLRYSDDKKEFDYVGASNTPGFPLIFADFLVGDSLNFDSIDPRFALDYQVTDDVMAYATWASGYKSGGVQFAVTDPETAKRGFGKEQLDMTEVGIKSRLWNDRVQLNAAAYRYKYKDQQVQSILLINGAPTALTQNAASSTMDGVELDFVALLTEALTFNFNYAWQDAKFDRFESIDGDRSGNRMAFAPEHAVVAGLNYVMELGTAGTITLDGNYSWKDDYYFDFDNSPDAFQDSYGVWNLAAWWQSSNASTRVRVFCDNCSDEEYLLNVVVFPAPLGGGGRQSWARPRRFGAEVTYYF